jgi:hypothetical protein
MKNTISLTFLMATVLVAQQQAPTFKGHQIGETVDQFLSSEHPLISYETYDRSSCEPGYKTRKHSKDTPFVTLVTT